MIPIIEQHDGYWYVSVGGERLGKLKNRSDACRLANSLVSQAFVKGWERVIAARRKKLTMTHDGSCRVSD